MQYSDVEKLRSKNSHLKAIIWDHYRVFKQDLLQLQTNNENIRNQIFDEKQRHTEIVEYYSRKISLLEAELRNIRNYTPKNSKRKKINIHDPRWKFNELEEEGKYLMQEAESIFERVQDPKELLKKTQEKIISSQKKKPVRLDTDDSSSSCSNLFEKYDTLIMSSDEPGKDAEENYPILTTQKNKSENMILSANLTQEQKFKKDNGKIDVLDEEKFVSQSSSISNNTSNSYSFKFNFEDNGKEMKDELNSKESLLNLKKVQSGNYQNDSEVEKKYEKKSESIQNNESSEEDNDQEIFQFSHSDTLNKSSENSSSFSYSPQIYNDYEKNEVLENKNDKAKVEGKEESMNELTHDIKSQEMNSQSISSDNLLFTNKSETKSDNKAHTQSEDYEELSSKEMTNYFKLTNTDEKESTNNITQKSGNAELSKSDDDESEEEGEIKDESQHSNILNSSKNQSNIFSDDLPERKRVSYGSSGSSDTEKEELNKANVHINNDQEDYYNKNNISENNQKMKTNSSITISSQSNIKNDSLYSKVDISPLHIHDSSNSDNEDFESPNENEARPNLHLSPIANSQAGDSLSIGEESSDDGFYGRFNDSDVDGSNYS